MIINSSLNVGWIHWWSRLVLNFLLGDFYYWFNLLTSNHSAQIFSFYSWFSLGKLYIFRILLIFPWLSNLLACTWSYYFLIIFCISLVWIVIFVLSFLILNPLSFLFLIGFSKGLSNLFLFSKIKLLISLIFCLSL